MGKLGKMGKLKEKLTSITWRLTCNLRGYKLIMKNNHIIHQPLNEKIVQLFLNLWLWFDFLFLLTHTLYRLIAVMQLPYLPT